MSQDLIRRLGICHCKAQNSDIGNLGNGKAQGSGQNLESPCPTLPMYQKVKPSVCAAPKKFTGWCHSSAFKRKPASAFSICTSNGEKKPTKAAILWTKYRNLCSRKLVEHHTPSVCSSSPSNRSVIVLETGHQQTQQNNNAQGTISCTGPWEGPVEFLWSVSFWLFPIDPGRALKCLECLVAMKWVGHRAITLLSSMRSATCGLISKWLAVSQMS